MTWKRAGRHRKYVLGNDENLEAPYLSKSKKFFELKNRRARKRLLQLFIRYCDLKEDSFILDEKRIKIEIEDI